MALITGTRLASESRSQVATPSHDVDVVVDPLPLIALVDAVDAQVARAAVRLHGASAIPGRDAGEARLGPRWAARPVAGGAPQL